MQVRCKFGTLGPGQFQFNAPHGFCLGIDEEIVVADTHNHRIVVSLVFADSLKDPSHNFLELGRISGHFQYPVGYCGGGVDAVVFGIWRSNKYKVLLCFDGIHRYKQCEETAAKPLLLP